MVQAHPPPPEQETIALDSAECLPLRAFAPYCSSHQLSALTTSSHVVDLSVAFLHPQASISETIDFQLGLFAPAASPTQDIVFSQLQVHLQGAEASVVVQNVTDSSTSAEQRQTYLLGDAANGEEQRSADLCWKPGQRKIFNGWISAREETELSVSAFPNAEIPGRFS